MKEKKKKRRCQLCNKEIDNKNYFFCSACHKQVGPDEDEIFKARDTSTGSGCRRRTKDGAWIPANWDYKS